MSHDLQHQARQEKVVPPQWTETTTKLMPESYRKILATRFSVQELALLEILVCQLQIYTKVTLEGLASRLPLLITFESRRRRVQRFLKIDATLIQELWFSLLTVIVPKVVMPGDKAYLALDRTQWKDRNLFLSH